MPDRQEELNLRLAALMTRKFTSLQLSQILSTYSSLGQALGAPEKELCLLKGITTTKLKLLHEKLESKDTEKELERCSKSSTSLMLLGDENYPTLLSKIDDPPVLLWMRGELSDDDNLAIAVVGSRNASIYGTQQAARFSRELGRRRITVVSGLARGIDTAAHKGALESGGRTIAVIGSGLDALYPPESVRLDQDIAQRGALLSEFPLSTPAHAKNFPQRNRVISGLCVGTLVAQASKHSGSLITARLASEQGREVFAIPGKTDTDDYQGSHDLLKDGAKLV